jgi:hypothetical protein
MGGPVSVLPVSSGSVTPVIAPPISLANDTKFAAGAAGR